MVLENTYNNTLGQVNYTAGTVSNFPSGTITLMTVNFTALSASSGSSITFANSGLRTTDITKGGYSVMQGSVGGIVSVQDTADVLAQVNLQGRNASPSSRWITPLSVKLYEHSTGTLKYTESVTTAQNGSFSLSGLTPGTYDIVIKNSHTLASRTNNVVLAIGANTVDLGILKEGDANNDNYVTLLDFSVLASTFSKCQGTAGYDSRADFNADTCVSLLDFSLLASNFSQAGPSMSALNTLSALDAGRGRGVSSGKVKISLETTKRNYKMGTTFLMPVTVNAGTQSVDGAQVSLKFDPRYLRVKRIIAGTSLPIGLVSQYDNQKGTIQFAAGRLNGSNDKQFTLMIVEFEPIGVVKKTSITFGYGAVDGTAITYAGTNRLGSANNLTLQVTK